MKTREDFLADRLAHPEDYTLASHWADEIAADFEPCLWCGRIGCAADDDCVYVTLDDMDPAGDARSRPAAGETGS